MYGVIYKLTNKINGKIYIGQTVNYYNRMCEYKIAHKLTNRSKTNMPIYRSIAKHGWNNFTTEIVCECDSKENLNLTEIRFIAELNSRDRNVGYNVALGGLGGGIKWSEESKRKRSIQYSGKGHPCYGRRGKNAVNYKTVPESHKTIIANRYQDGVSIDQLVTEYKVNWNKIREVLIERNIKLRTRKQVMQLLPQNQSRWKETRAILN